jgi:hypothetical protein
MIMVYIAVSLCAVPIVVTLFFAVYKTLLLIQEKNRKIDVAVLEPVTTLSVENTVITIDSDDDEIVAVIAAAVSSIKLR